MKEATTASSATTNYAPTEIERLREENKTLRLALRQIIERLDHPGHEPTVSKLWRAINGYDITDFDKRAEALIRQHLDGCWVGDGNRGSIKLVIVQHFEQVDMDARKAAHR